MRIFCLILSMGLWCLSAVTWAQSTIHNVMLGQLAQDGMNLSSGVRRENLHWVLWSRPIAQAYNPNGFITNDFIPFCQVDFKLIKAGSAWHEHWVGPMRLTVTGPEYGTQVQLQGPGHYQWKIHYQPPVVNGFYRHIDKATGVAPWWKPFTLTYQFTLTPQGQIVKGATS
ncbi:MAG: hypothetical protein CENE_02697 [Candidatus Celerinatantimonas neptuna]|nr:MAG: hypothetical protein CENE_02697 [Candidatus Celerinatantimonas neptuna]